MKIFNPDLQTVEPSQESLKESLWYALEKVIPDTNHEYNDKLKFIKDKYIFLTYEGMASELGELDKESKRSIKNRINGLVETKDIPPELCLYMKAEREDGSFAYVVIGVGAIVKYRADFISPAYYEGRGGNHDFKESELLGNLYNAVKLPKYPNK